MPTTPIFLAIYIAAVNDSNGNPRRGWYVSRLDGQPVIPEVPPNGHNSGKAPVYTAWIEDGYGNFPWPTFATALGIETTSYYDARDKAQPYVYETRRIGAAPGEYRAARKLPRFGAQ